MAMLASKSPYPTPSLGGGSSQSATQYTSGAPGYRNHTTTARNEHAFFVSPTDSTFSEELYDAPDSVKNWDENKVGDWLKRINCAQYVDLFKQNHINGENLMEMDQSHLKDMGIKKVGDRVRIGSQAKQLRNKEYKKASKRSSNRQSLATLDNTAYTPPSSGSPRPLPSGRSLPSSRSEKRMSTMFTGSDLKFSSSYGGKSPSRPSSPLVDQENRGLRPQRYGALNSPKDGKGEHGAYTGHPLSASSSSANIPGRYGATSRTTPTETPQTAVFNHSRGMSLDSATNSAILPNDKALIRVIFDGGRSSVVQIEGCKSADDIILKTLKKGQLNEAHVKNYCFYVLEGSEPNPALCRRLTDIELFRLCKDYNRHERGRLILRKIHTGEPEEEQLKAAAGIYQQQGIQQNQNIILPSSNRSQLKIQQITGESLAAVSYPLSPTSARERERHIHSTAQDLEGPARSPIQVHAARARKLKQFYGARPPSELITSDLTSYFPDVEKDEIDKTIRMSVRRSRRLSRAASRLSMASNFSVASSLRDAPPLPSIADNWLQGQARPLRPLSVMRLGLPSQSGYRDSMASSVLEPLEEESPLEPNRKSYVSFGGDSGSDTLAVTDPDGQTTLQSYFDDGGSSLTGSSAGNTENGDSLNKRLSQAIADDGEEYDDELADYLEQDSWENVKYMKGALIGQGSFGSVYLALHAVTGELMAVKQVEMPSATSLMDQRKTNMVEALKHEIGLLRDLKHKNIVQYLGSNSDDSHLNIFLEYVPGGSVATMLVNYGPLGESLIQNFVRQILQGLSYLHSRDIIHRDIKGANILVDNKGSVKISDFGISKRVEASTLLNGPSGGKKGAQRVSLQGSVFWMAPEVVRQTAYTRKADIWSLGCLIVEMFTGSHPHPNCTQLQAIFKIGGSGDACPTMPETAGADAQAFLAQTFLIDHEKRPSADELLVSPFCAEQAA
ncbi:Pkinase-domain-containing protein [Aaosphaeria arxii CBS 175.79]|uniref:mitogen-activated protein kinase kinase kinase n=1 Tax=Aaosphaeria arxii CBS 175.79 TaxID=1450172 RepID=A0A6A5XXA3_9PLEO|nr:Pkinase-domain-containing protein [Aaosphaeria arxii CBS 175.79]KAF2017270.1 Pkinase-domain-containing protein [Aaosphaeria arxii CBS 175.79]